MPIVIGEPPNDPNTVTVEVTVPTRDVVIATNGKETWMLPYDGGEVRMDDPRWKKVGGRESWWRRLRKWLSS